MGGLGPTVGYALDFAREDPPREEALARADDSQKHRETRKGNEADPDDEDPSTPWPMQRLLAFVRRRWLILTIAGGTCLVLGVGVSVIVTGSTPSASASPSATPTPAASATLGTPVIVLAEQP